MPDELYSNCVILDFAAPITRGMVSIIRQRLLEEWAKDRLPSVREVVVGEREGNSVVPTIAADEC
jgi:hypothetical protein